MANKNRILPRTGLRRLFKRIKEHFVPSPRKGPRVMQVFAKQFPHCFFIQIGSNDGKQQDPLCQAIHQWQWSGIMIEPVPYVFPRLKQNYGMYPSIALENLAIADHDGTMPLYHLAQAEPGPGLPVWYDALGSFSKEVILKHVSYIPDIEQRIVCSHVPCLTFSSLCEKHGVRKVDLIHLDTEGYDFEILKRIDFSRYRPRLLIYEHHHLSDTDRRACRKYLSDLGYATMEEVLDTWCVDLRGDDAAQSRFLKQWHRIMDAQPQSIPTADAR
ncbi:MAG: FkbM family methyltransferase [Gammaproteobacteria bacterium]|nr:FkbM family methyltransferase [Gammaproteobacteria bacterium]